MVFRWKSRERWRWEMLQVRYKDDEGGCYKQPFSPCSWAALRALTTAFLLLLRSFQRYRATQCIHRKQTVQCNATKPKENQRKPACSAVNVVEAQSVLLYIIMTVTGFMLSRGKPKNVVLLIHPQWFYNYSMTDFNLKLLIYVDKSANFHFYVSA